MIRGWAADKNRLNTSISVKIYDGNTLVTTVPANQLRTDVGAYLKDNGVHGFNIPTPAAFKTGTHSLSVRFESSATNLVGSPKSISCGPTTPSYTGSFDQADCSTIYGWAADRNRLNTPINVSIYDGATLLMTVPANQSRPDVGAYLKDNGLHGFTIPIPTALKNGQPHSIGVRFESSATGLGGSPKTITCTTLPPPIVTGYSWNATPIANQPFGGTISGAGFVSGGTQVWFCLNGSATCYQHPAAGVNVNSLTNLTVSGVNLGAGAWQFFVRTSAGQSARSTAFTVQSPTHAPTITGYSWNTTPTAGQPFSGTVTGSGFVSGGTQVWFCTDGSATCYQHPGAGVTVNGPTNLTVSGVNLGGGSWQLYVKTSAGQSARSAAFTVQTPAPTIAGYSWNTTSTANQPFGGTVSGTGFVSGGTQVWFCVSGSSTCYQHPAAGVAVSSSTSLSVSGVNLGIGSWQLYVQTSDGQSRRSASFNVQAGAPTISGYSWNTTPTAGQSFGGTIFGTDFITGGTRIWFCVYDSGTCYEHPAAGINVNNSSNLSINGVNLGNGSWQFYLQTSAGQSRRSTPFSVR